MNVDTRIGILKQSGPPEREMLKPEERVVIPSYSTLKELKENVEQPGTRARISPDTTADALLVILAHAGLPIFDYGPITFDDGRNNLTKKFNLTRPHTHLRDELSDRKSVLSMDSKHELLREVNVAAIDIICTLADGNIYILREDRQESCDGRVWRHEDQSTLREVMIVDEDPTATTEQTIYEAIGVGTTEVLHSVGSVSNTYMSKVYPELRTKKSVHSFVASIPEASFTPEGYVRQQPDRTIYYVWDPLAIARE